MLDISVVVTNYNNEKYIGRAIRSCLNQSVRRDAFEIIVVDDASTDNSRTVIDSFGSKIKSICFDTNSGVARASNAGIEAALGRFIIRVDSDDYINEHTLLFLSEILDKNKDIGFVYADHLRVDQSENVIERVDITTPELLFRHGAGIMFRKSHMEAIGLYDPELRNAEDYALLKKYIKNWDGYHLPLPLYRYRQHQTNMTKDDTERKRWEKIADENRE
jgi:glycosyltransferase involved in cell wall biosynthesis